MLQFQYMAPWVPGFQAALESETAPFITFLFATVDSSGFPHNRTLVFRGFLFNDKTNNVLTFTLDKRLEKYAELLQNDAFEAVFYFVKRRHQFRFRGRARLIDSSHTPAIDLSTIQPKHILQNSTYSGSNSSSSGSDSEDENLNITVALSLSLSVEKESLSRELAPQQLPIPHTTISPSLLLHIQKDTSHTSLLFTNLHDLTQFEFKPPTQAEWDGEIRRQWSTLLKLLQASFRKPVPKSPLTEEKRNMIDKIMRGVDGKKPENGLVNFAVAGLFVDYVDFVDLEKDRRYIYSKDSGHMWSEQEVCP